MADYSVAYDGLDALLQGLPENTAATPYEIEIASVTLEFMAGAYTAVEGTLQYVLQQNAGKYVSLTWGAEAATVLDTLTTANHLFDSCPSLTSVDVSAMTAVTNAGYMFAYCSSITSVDVSAMTAVTNAVGMFRSCQSLTSVDVSAMTAVTSAGYMFHNCPSLTSVDVSAMTAVTNAVGMFYDCLSLTSVDVSAMTAVTHTGYMFRNCQSLTSVDVSAMTAVTSAVEMFRNCQSLEEIHGWSVPLTATITNCFYNCPSLRAIYVPEVAPQESDWHAWDIKKDTANSRTDVTIYGVAGTPVTTQIPSAGTYTIEVDGKTDELLLSATSAITPTHIQKMLQTKAPITGNANALDPTKDNFVMLAKDRTAAKTNITTDVVEAGNLLPPTSAAVHAAIGALIPIPTGTVLPYGGTTAPAGFHLCDNALAVRSAYQNLIDWAVEHNAIGNGKLLGPGNGSTTFRFPDLRECVIVGAGQNAKYGINTHDVYTVGQFRDDQLQNHVHNYNIHNTQAGNDRENKPYEVDGETTRQTGGVEGARVGDCTHGKQLGMNFIIKL